jgi:hypothetical protein
MVIESMMSLGIGSQASIGKALNPDPITTKAINRSSILVNGIKSKTYSGKAINPVYWSLPNNRLELTAAMATAWGPAAQP